MAKLTNVEVTYGRKMNLGDFNSSHVEITLNAELEPGDDEAAVTEALRQMARNNVMAELARLKPELRAKTEELFMGLPKDIQDAVLDAQRG